MPMTYRILNFRYYFSTINASKFESKRFLMTIFILYIQAVVLVWDAETKQEIGSYKVHREEVVSVMVSVNDKYVISLGGVADGTLVIWDVINKKPICSKYSNNNNQITR